MNSSQTWPSVEPQAKRPESADRARLFYIGAAALLLVLMFVGFQQFYLHGKAYPKRELTPPIRTLLILHGGTMTGWMLLFLAQPLLIVFGHRRVHLIVGRFGAVLAAGVVFLGLRVGIEAARVNPPDLKIWGLVPKQFLALPIFSILLFAVFVTFIRNLPAFPLASPGGDTRTLPWSCGPAPRLWRRPMASAPNKQVAQRRVDSIPDQPLHTGAVVSLPLRIDG